MVMNEWGVNEGGADKCIDEWELTVVKMKFVFLLWLGRGCDKTTMKSG